MAEEHFSAPLKLDPDAASADSELPALLAKPAGAPVYHGFPVVPESMTNGWCYGAITEFENPSGCEHGDGYVIAPDGRRAGLVWSVGSGNTSEVCSPSEDRWGVYAVWFPQPVHTVADLVASFRLVLPDLQKIHAKIFDRGTSQV
jgi:hypothetical protein